MLSSVRAKWEKEWKLRGLIWFPDLPNSPQGFAVITYFIGISSAVPCLAACSP